MRSLGTNRARKQSESGEDGSSQPLPGSLMLVSEAEATPRAVQSDREPSEGGAVPHISEQQTEMVMAISP